tara:strand:+ start:147 stop:350 length:204 start_codon:yes stop_codon:yes gene_type:complete
MGLDMYKSLKEFAAIVKKLEDLGTDENFIEIYLRAKRAEEQLIAFKIIAVSVMLGVAIIIPLVVRYG